MDASDFQKPKQSFFTDTRLGLFSWTENSSDYRIIAELIPLSKNSSETISILSEINKLLPKDYKYIFDGTISSLRYLIKDQMFDAPQIKNPLLKKIALKHLNDSEESNRIRVNPNRWSGQALRCKAILIGLYLDSGKLKLTRGLSLVSDLETLNENDFPLFDDDVEKGKLSDESVKKMTNINAMWIGLASMSPWNQNKDKDIAEFIMEKVVSSHFRGSYMYDLLNKFQPYIDQVAEKYFPGFHRKDCRACVAVRHAAIAVMYKLSDNFPKEAVRHPELRIDGFLDKWVEYVFTSDFQVQGWFIRYLQEELDIRINLIKILLDEKIVFEPDEKIEKMMQAILEDKKRGQNEAIYLPIYDGFRFFPPGMLPMIAKLVKVFRNRSIGILEKDKIAQAIIINLQKLITYRDDVKDNTSDPQHNKFILQEKYLRDAFNMLMLNILFPLAKSTFRTYSQKIEGYKEQRIDLFQIINTELLSSILKYDKSRNSSFFGYIKHILPLYVKSKIRKHKADQTSSSLEDILETNPEKVGSVYDLEDKVIIGEIKTKMNQIIDTLPQKEKEAIAKAFYKNEKLTDTERKAKNRGLHKLRLNYPELQELL